MIQYRSPLLSPKLTVPELWRKNRGVGKFLMNPKSMPSYTSAESVESSITVLELLGSPVEYERHIERFTSGVLFRVSMGKRVLTGKEEYVRFVFEDIHRVEKVASPGANLCDPFPVL